MKRESRFSNKPKMFWATVRSISQELRTPNLDRDEVDVADLQTIQAKMAELSVNDDNVRPRNETERAEVKEFLGFDATEIRISEIIRGYFYFFMKPSKIMLRQNEETWRVIDCMISDGSAHRDNNSLYVPTPNVIRGIFKDLGLDPDIVADEDCNPTEFGRELVDYFRHRAHVLETKIRPSLMEVTEARRRFHDMNRRNRQQLPLPMNKQKGEMKDYAYFTGIINMIIYDNKGAMSCDYDPRKLTTVTQNGAPLRTLARRVDGAFPTCVDPTAIWEIKEYYYTTTFGSRVADGVYETILDGQELEELYKAENRHIYHILFVDSYYTWWSCGKSYLARIVDMLHMGLVDEVLFGKEIFERLPSLVSEWQTR
jgi:hypothetical protein